MRPFPLTGRHHVTQNSLQPRGDSLSISESSLFGAFLKISIFGASLFENWNWNCFTGHVAQALPHNVGRRRCDVSRKVGQSVCFNVCARLLGFYVRSAGAYARTHTHMHQTHIHVCVWCMCVCVCAYTCLYMQTYVGKCVCMRIFIRARMCLYT